MNNDTQKQMEQEYPAEEENHFIDTDSCSSNSEIIDSEVTSSLIAEDGSFSPDWFTRFEELATSEKTLAKFKRPEALAKSYAELEKLRTYPDSPDDSRMALFRSFVGLPEKAEDFHLDRPEGIQEECWNESLAGDMAKVAHEYGVPARAMNALAETYARQYSAYLEEYESKQEKGRREVEESLRQDWGDDFDRARLQASSAVKMLAKKAGLPSEDIIEDPTLGSNPTFIKIMREVAMMMDEAPLRRGDVAHSVPGEEARRIESDPDHPLHDAYMKPSHPNHKYANEVYDKLAFGRK